MSAIRYFRDWLIRVLADYPPVIDMRRVLIDAKNRQKGK